MRLIPVCLSLVLAPLIVSGQQTKPASSPKPEQTSAPKHATTHASHKAVTRHRAHRHSRKASMRKGARAENTTMPVDVISGGEVHRVLLEKPRSDAKQDKANRGQMKVDIINGSATDTQYFSDRGQETARNQAVVVGVQSSDTRFASGNKNPVVTGITSSSTVDAKTVSSGGEGVTRQVSPRPKRPAYQPDVQ